MRTRALRGVIAAVLFQRTSEVTLQEMRTQYAEKVRALDALRKSVNASETDMARARLWFEEAQELKTKLDKAEEQKAYADQFNELSKSVQIDSTGRVVSHGGIGGSKAPSLRFSEEDVRRLHAKTVNHESVSIKAAIDTGDVPQAVIPGYSMSRIGFDREPTRIIDRLNVQPTDRPSVIYYKLTTPASAAATVTEGGLKPTSNPIFEPFTATVVKIAHIASATDETVADYPAFAGFLSNEMVRGLAAEEDRQLLVGDGSGGDIVVSATSRT
jgi:HK97 family phage major capsid protein